MTKECAPRENLGRLKTQRQTHTRSSGVEDRTHCNPELARPFFSTRTEANMTSVLPTTRHSGHYAPENNESEEFISSLNYISDTDTEGYSGNPASPLIHIPGANGDCLRGQLFEDEACESTAGPEYRITRGRWGEPGSYRHSDEQERERAQLSMVALLLATVRRSLVASCHAAQEENTMDIGWPTDVQHVAHVTFDRYNGFLGLPEEFEVEIPRRVPSASQSVFGVSAESMQCAYDARGNSVPTILLLMQERLYYQGGLKVEGIFRINAENSHEEHVRDQLNKGIVPLDIDLHCLAGLIKAWFRELPQGILDALTPEQVLSCHTEEESVALVKLLPPTQAALLDWAVNLMADVVQEEVTNKMNSRNIAMVFAPNMTQMADPLTALMHAVQVMNLLKTLILRTLKGRQEALLEHGPAPLGPETPDADEPDNDYGGVLLNGHERHSSVQREDAKVDYDQYAHRLLLPSKRSNKAKVKNGRMVNTIDHHNERVEAW